MTDTGTRSDPIDADVVTVRYWAAARAAAGRASDEIGVTGRVSLVELRERVLERYAATPDSGSRLAAVLASCSVLVGDRPVSSLDPASVLVGAGDSVEFLPPFAGG